MPKPAPILLVDDDESEVFLVRHALEKAGVNRELVPLRDGRQAIHYLAGTGPYVDRDRYPLPAFVLLDMKMPGVDGFDVLAWRQRRPELAGVPLLAYTTSTAECDIQRISRLGAQDYLLKPHDPYQLVLMMKRLAAQWLRDGASAEAEARRAAAANQQ